MLFTNKNFVFCDFPKKKKNLFQKMVGCCSPSPPPPQLPSAYSSATEYLYGGQKTASNDLDERILCADSSRQCQL